MKSFFSIVGLIALLSSDQAIAQTILPNPTAAEASAPRPARGHGVPASLAIEAAETAIATCRDNGYKVTAIAVDTEGVPIAMISGDGAAAITQRIAMGKAVISLKTKMSSGEAAAKAKTDSAFNSMLMNDPSLGVPRPGGILIQRGQDILGAFAVSGTPSGAIDERCARAGLAKVQDRLR